MFGKIPQRHLIIHHFPSLILAPDLRGNQIKSIDLKTFHPNSGFTSIYLSAAMFNNLSCDIIFSINASIFAEIMSMNYNEGVSGNSGFSRGKFIRIPFREAENLPKVELWEGWRHPAGPEFGCF